MRNASSALPSTASTAGPGSAFHGSVASSSAFVSRMSRHVASRARWGCPSAHATVASATTGRRHRRQRAVGIGAGPRSRRTSSRPPSPPGTPGCRGCWPDRRCSGRDALVGEVAVRPERRVAQQVVAEPRRRRSLDQVAGAIWLSLDLDIFSPRDEQPPVHQRWAGGSIPAAMHMAGHHTQWNRMMSLPIRWCTAGHHASKRARPRRSRWRSGS
jgi:hypothetical protein